MISAENSEFGADEMLYVLKVEAEDETNMASSSYNSVDGNEYPKKKRRKKCKRSKRASNFMPLETQALIELVLPIRYIIDSPVSNQQMWKRKTATWRKIQNEIAKRFDTQRTVEGLRDKYDGIKSDIRKRKKLGLALPPAQSQAELKLQQEILAEGTSLIQDGNSNSTNDEAETVNETNSSCSGNEEGYPARKAKKMCKLECIMPEVSQVKRSQDCRSESPASLDPLSEPHEQKLTAKGEITELPTVVECTIPEANQLKIIKPRSQDCRSESPVAMDTLSEPHPENVTTKEKTTKAPTIGSNEEQVESNDVTQTSSSDANTILHQLKIKALELDIQERELRIKLARKQEREKDLQIELLELKVKEERRKLMFLYSAI